jgi:acyl dehydratase
VSIARRKPPRHSRPAIAQAIGFGTRLTLPPTLSSIVTAGGKLMVEIGGYEVLGLGLHFEDLPQGRKFRTIGRSLTEADLVNFIGVTGMTEVLFTNLEFLRNESDIAQRVVPAAMVYAFAEGLLVHATMQHTGFAFLHMELNVVGPSFVGDTIHVECEVIESRRSASRPNRGLVRTRNNVVKQDGKVALTYTPLRMVKAREGG